MAITRSYDKRLPVTTLWVPYAGTFHELFPSWESGQPDISASCGMFSLRAEWGAPLPPLQLVGPDAQAGAVEVMVSESKGLEQPFTLTLRAARDDVAITFEHDS